MSTITEVAEPSQLRRAVKGAEVSQMDVSKRTKLSMPADTMVWLVIASVALTPGMSAAGLLGNNIDLYALTQVMHTDNLFLADDSTTSDQRLRLGVGLDGEVDLGRQKIKLAAQLHDNRFNDSDQLDYQGGNLAATWLWTASDRFSGNLGIRGSDDLTDFDEFRAPIKDKVQIGEVMGEAGYNISDRIRLEVQGGARSLEHSRDARKPSNEDRYDLEAAFLVKTRGGSFLGLIGSMRDGDYYDRELQPDMLSDTGYRRYRGGATFRWEPSAKTRLRLDAGYTKRKQDNYSDRDYGEPWWRMDAAWQASSRTELVFSTRQDIVSIDDRESSFATESLVSLGATWRRAEKTEVSLNAEYRERDFSQNLSVLTNGRDDKDFRLVFRAAQLLRQRIELSLESEYWTRDSNRADLEYDSWSLTAAVRVLF